MHNEKGIPTAIVHYLCPICTKKSSENLIISKKITKKAHEEFDNLHDKPIGFGEPCESCQKYIDDDYIAMVEIDSSKSEIDFDEGLADNSGAYRTGNIAWMKKDKAEIMFNTEITKPMIFIDSDVIPAIESLIKQE